MEYWRRYAQPTLHWRSRAVANGGLSIKAGDAWNDGPPTVPATTLTVAEPAPTARRRARAGLPADRIVEVSLEISPAMFR